MALSRRQFIALSAVGAVGVAAVGLPIYHFRYGLRHPRPTGAQHAATRATPKLGSWQDLYRERWTWDHIARGTHGWLNCRSACNWNIYVKKGVVVREEQAANYESSEPGIVPDFNPRGCQKGACYTEVMYGPSRLTVPLKRVGERGSGQWQKISWEQAITEVATKFVDIAATHGSETLYHDLGPHFDQGGTSAARTKFFMLMGASIADDWAEIGDLNIGATMTFGFPHMGGTSDEWFLSDFLVVWMMNPSVTQIPDAHFLYEAKYGGATLTVIDPQYSATAVHADHWLPIKPGTDAALGLCTARHIWDSGRMNVEYVREQTDLPILVRLDTGRFLRASEMVADGKLNELYFWDEKPGKPVIAPGSEGADNRRLFLKGVQPAIEGQWDVTLLDGTTVRVSTVGSILREQLQMWTVEATAEVTGLHPKMIEQFAEGFAKAERPLLLSSWGGNRFFHSDLMNRSKILCLALKGAIGKRGAGLNATGWFGMEGFELSAEMERTGIPGVMGAAMKLMSAKDAFYLGIDMAIRKKHRLDVMRDLSHHGSTHQTCMTNSASMNYNYAGVKDVLAEEQKDLAKRPLDSYVQEAQDKGWMPVFPQKSPPKAWITGGNNVLRRSNQPQNMMATLWKGLECIVDINPKLTFTGMNADYLFPAAGYYEKPGIKYPVAYVPYLHYCDAAVAPVGESKDEWEIYSLLAREVSRIARERNMPAFEACGGRTIDYKEVDTKMSSHGAFSPKDAEAVTQQILTWSTSTLGMTTTDLKETGIRKYTSTGATMVQSQLYNSDWTGKGVLTIAQHQVKDKWAWPTLTGRMQFYIDHPWFIENGESLPAHKESPKAGGDHPFQLISCHARHSIHSIWRDTPMLLRLQRGEPVVLLNPKDAERLGIADHEWAELENRIGKMHWRVKHSTMVRPGVAYHYHAWEPYQFPDHQSYKWVTPGLMNPLHFAGGEGHLGWRFAIYEPGTHVQDTRVTIRPWKAQNDKETAERKHAAKTA
ncbi:MAG: molybdopterin-dependent oxidoreductase [Gammaproteobacteria bacterium]